MDTTRAQQKALDDDLVTPANRLKIGKSNLRLSSNLKSKEPTLQVALDALKLTSIYRAFEIAADVPKIYMQEFWVTVSRHHSLLRFKMNGKSHTVNVDNFREMLQICPKHPGQKFEDPPFEEEILSFIRDLGHTSKIKVLSDVNVNHMHQPWRSFVAIINKCLSGKTTTLESLRLSCAQILWGMYHNKSVDYVYLLWEDLVYQVENKNSKKNNDMDDPMFTTIKVIFKHQDTQLYGALLPQHLTNQTMLESEAYKTYHAYSTSEKIPKPKYVKNKAEPESPPKKKSALTSEGKRLKTSAKVSKPAKKKQPATMSKAKGLNVLSEVALSKDEQMKLATKRSKTQFHSSHASGSGVDKGTGVTPGVPDVPTYDSKDEQISWKSSDEDDDEVNVSEDNDDQDDADNEDDDDQDDADNKDDDDQDNANNKDDDGQEDDDEQTDSENDGDDFVHPKFSTHDQEERQDKEEEGSDLRVQTPSHYESTDDEECDEVTQGGNVRGEELNEETDEEEEVNELYRDVNVNMEGRDTEMTDAPQTNVQGTEVTEDTHVIMTAATPEVQQQSSSVSSGFISNMLNPNPDIGIDFILNLNTESTSLVDVPISMTVEMPHSSFEDRVKALEDGFSEFKQTNQFAAAVSSIPGIVDTYLANKMNEAVKIAVQLHSDRLRDEAQAENPDFINKLDDNIKKIIKEQVKVQVKDQVSNILPKIEKLVNDQLEAEVLTRSSNEAKTSHAIAANLSELELKKILIDKMESNKSIYRSDQQNTLYRALVDTYESEKLILDTYGDTVTIKRHQDDQDEDEEPCAGSNQGSKRRRAGKEPKLTSAPKEKTFKSSGKSKDGSKSHNTSTSKSVQSEEPIHANKDLEEPAHQEFDTEFTKDQPVDETTQHHDWFHKPIKPPTPVRDWNKTLHVVHGPIQPWISNLAQKEDTHNSFNELIDTPLDFSAFVMNWLKVDTLTPELLAGLTFELMKGLCKSLVKLKYFLEEVCKGTSDKLDWNNLEGQQYPHDLCKPLPLIPNLQGRRVIPFDHFINNNLAYLRGGSASYTYATSVMKTKAADYGHVKWIEDLVPNTMWSPVPVIYDKHALWGISY
ncbi:hypothetical protein Tco_0030931 [Tanacetum coccineum]